MRRGVIKKIEGMENVPVADEADTIRFLLDENKFVECRIENGRLVIRGHAGVSSQMVVFPKVGNSIEIDFGG